MLASVADSSGQDVQPDSVSQPALKQTNLFTFVRWTTCITVHYRAPC